MRRWHRLIAPWFAVLLLIIALTGVATQVTDLIDKAQPRAASEHGAAKPPAPAPAAQPRPERSAIGAWNHWFKKLHSGESLGPVGIALNLAGGLALLFFAGSGFWMYLSMAIRRARNQRARRG